MNSPELVPESVDYNIVDTDGSVVPVEPGKLPTSALEKYAAAQKKLDALRTLHVMLRRQKRLAMLDEHNKKMKVKRRKKNKIAKASRKRNRK